jgi:predicted nucleic acid-binding protein
VTVLVDTSVWVDHLRSGNDRLAALLDGGHAMCHRLVIGELACGNLRNREETLQLLQALPCADEATFEESLRFVDNHRLHGRGLGWIDVRLLASALLTPCPLWTLDRRLAAAAASLGAADDEARATL